MNLTVSLCLHSHNFLRQYDTTDSHNYFLCDFEMCVYFSKPRPGIPWLPKQCES